MDYMKYILNNVNKKYIKNLFILIFLIYFFDTIFLILFFIFINLLIIYYLFLLFINLFNEGVQIIY